MAFDSTIGGAAANSYVSVAEADDILSQRVGAGTTWTALSPTQKQAALISATRRLEQESFDGCIISINQALQFPAYDIVDKNGIPYPIDEIPVPVKLACAELAFLLIRDPDLLDDTGLEQFSSLTVDKLNISKDSTFRPGQLPTNVARYISHLRGGTGLQLVRG